MNRILIVDDDIELCELVTEYLSEEGFSCDSVHEGNRGFARAVSGDFQLVILDVMLPGMNGLEVLRQIRNSSTESASVPILMLTARGGETIDRIIGLEIGADDYLGKPFHPRELVARIRAILRRTESTVATPSTARQVWTIGDITLDTGARTVLRGKEPIALTAIEFEVLTVLLREAGQVVSRETLVRAALDRKALPYDRSIDMHVSNLRRKIGDQGGTCIKSIRSIGYQYVLPVAGK